VHTSRTTHPQHAAGLTGGVQGPRRDARPRRFDAAEQRRRHGRDHQPEAEPGHRETGDDRVHRDRRQAARGEQGRPREDGPARVAEAAGEQVRDPHRDRRRGEGQAGDQGRPAEDLLQVEPEHEDQPVERDVDEQPDRRRRGEHRPPEQTQRQHRRRAAGLGGDEPEPGEHGEPGEAEHRWCGEPRGAADDRRAGQRGEGRDGGELTRQVDAATDGRRLHEPAGGDQHPGDPQRHVDQEQRAPPGDLDEQPAEQRARGQRDARPRRPDPDRAGTGGRRRMRVRDERQRAGHQDRRPDPLHRARRDQRPEPRGQPAGDGGQREQHEPAGEQAAGADPVAERARGQDQRGEGDGVGVHHPLPARDAPAEGPPDGLDRDVHGGHVQLHHAEAQRRGDQGPGPGTHRRHGDRR
jgi:hypothetical protein